MSKLRRTSKGDKISMLYSINLLKLLQEQNGFPERPYIPHLTPDMCINIKRKQMVNNGDSYKICIEVLNRVINDEAFIINYKEIHDHSTGESWITEFSGSVKSSSIRANMLRYDDVTGNNTCNFRGHETYLLHSNRLLKFKYGSNQGNFFLMYQFTPEQFESIKANYKRVELSKDEAMELLVGINTKAIQVAEVPKVPNVTAPI